MTDTPPPAEPPAAQTEPAEDVPVAEAPAAPARRRWMPRRRGAVDTTPEAAGGDTAAATPEAITPAPAAESVDTGGTPDDTDDDDAPAGSPRRLRRDRRKLITQREEAVYHLGGLAFELYRRDMLEEEVMRTRAGEVAQIDDTIRDIDVRLGEIDRERRDRRRPEAPDPSVGCCLVCRTPFQAEARFCWQCGAQVIPPSMGDEQVTAVISTGPVA